MAVVAAIVTVWTITHPTFPKSVGNADGSVEKVELAREGSFRIKQLDEILESAINKGEECIGQGRTKGSVVGACIRDYLDAAQLVTVGMELGGIYRPPGKDDADTVWIAYSGYGLRHLPSRQGYKNKKYSDRDFRDIAQDYSILINQQARNAVSNVAKVEDALANLKKKAQFIHSDILKDWFRRHQAQGEYKSKYGDAYKVYDMQVDDYQDELNKINSWVLSVQDAWKRFKSLKEIAPFI